MKRQFAIFALMLVTGMAAFASEPQDRPPQEGEATFARQRLQLSLAYAGGPPVMITIRDGEVGRLRHPANGLAFRLKATYDPVERNAVVTFYDLENWDDETSSTDDATVNIPLTAVNLPLAAEAVRVPEVTSQSSSGARLASLQVGSSALLLLPHPGGVARVPVWTSAPALLLVPTYDQTGVV